MYKYEFLKSLSLSLPLSLCVSVSVFSLFSVSLPHLSLSLSVCLSLSPFVSLGQFDLPSDEYADCLPEGDLLGLPVLAVDDRGGPGGGVPGGPAPSPSLDFNDNDIPTELSDSSETHDEGEAAGAGRESGGAFFCHVL